MSEQISDIESQAMLAPRNREEAFLLEKERDKFNTYATNKSWSQEGLNTAIISQYVGIFIGLFSTYDSSKGFTNFEIALVVLVGISLVIQFVIFTLLVILIRTTRDKVG